MARIPKKSEVLKACLAPLDFSGFDQLTTQLTADISEWFDARVRHQDDVNYSASHELCLFVDENFSFIPPNASDLEHEVWNAAHFIIEILVSCRGSYFTIRTLTKDAKPNVAAIPRTIPQKISALVERVEAFLHSRGFCAIPNEILELEVEGKVTDLDGKQATVYEVIFSEL